MYLTNLLIDRRGALCGWNARAQRIFRCGADDITGEPLSRLLAQPGAEAAADELLAGAARVGYADYKGACIRQDGSSFAAQLLVTRLDMPAGDAVYSLVVQDLSEQAAGETRRRNESERVSSIIESAMDAIVTVDEEQRIVLFNRAAERIFRCPAAEALAGTLDRFIPHRYRSVHHGHIERFSATGVTMRRMGDRTVLTGLRSNGEEFPIEASISQVTVDGRRLFTVILRDITERQQAAAQLEQTTQQLRELYARMHEVREAERTRIARELHDELAQWLTALKMDASWVRTRLPADQEALAKRMDRVRNVIDNTIAAVRRIAADLRPVMLDDLGIAAAIENLVTEHAERTGVAARLESALGPLMLEDPAATAVYRMVQEALTNVARHSEASEVVVELRHEGDQLRIMVLDNGRGLPPEPDTGRKSYGVLGIRERAHTLGGTADIRNHERGGVVVDIAVPVIAGNGVSQ